MPEHDLIIILQYIQQRNIQKNEKNNNHRVLPVMENLKTKTSVDISVKKADLIIILNFLLISHFRKINPVNSQRLPIYSLLFYQPSFSLFVVENIEIKNGQDTSIQLL